MYSDFAKREKTPQEKLLEEALKDAQDIPQAHVDWWELEASDEEINAYYDLAYTAEFWQNATIPQLAVLIDTRSLEDLPDKDGRTALMYACQYCPAPEVILWFLNFHPDPHYVDKDGKTAEYYVTENPALSSYADILAALKFENLLCSSFWKTATSQDVAAELKQGKDVNMRDNLNETPLMLACRYCHNAEIIQMLLQAGANVNAQADLRFNTALMSACRWNNLEVVKLLVQAGANVNYAADRGYTALMSAAEFNPDAEVIRYLVANGADIAAKDMYRSTARTYLKRNKTLAKDKKIAAFLHKLEWKAWWHNFVQKFRK